MSANDDAIEQLRDAIGTHGLWKGRFVHALRTGVSSHTPAEVRADDRCAFGLWLGAGAHPALRGDPEFVAVQTLHAEFHRVAAEVLERALRGGTDVETLVGSGSPYAKATASLTQAMVAWERKLSV